MSSNAERLRAHFARRRAELEQRLYRAVEETQRAVEDVEGALAPDDAPGPAPEARVTFVVGARLTSVSGKSRFVPNETAASEARPKGGLELRWVPNEGAVTFGPFTEREHFQKAARDVGLITLRRAVDEALRGT